MDGEEKGGWVIQAGEVVRGKGLRRWFTEVGEGCLAHGEGARRRRGWESSGLSSTLTRLLPAGPRGCLAGMLDGGVFLVLFPSTQKIFMKHLYTLAPCPHEVCCLEGN